MPVRASIGEHLNGHLSDIGQVDRAVTGLETVGVALRRVLEEVADDRMQQGAEDNLADALVDRDADDLGADLPPPERKATGADMEDSASTPATAFSMSVRDRRSPTTTSCAPSHCACPSWSPVARSPRTSIPARASAGKTSRATLPTAAVTRTSRVMPFARVRLDDDRVVLRVGRRRVVRAKQPRPGLEVL